MKVKFQEVIEKGINYECRLFLEEWMFYLEAYKKAKQREHTVAAERLFGISGK